MPVTSTREVLHAATSRRRGVAAVNVFQVEHATAIVAAAEACETSVILQISQNTVRYHGALAPLAAATMVVAEAASVPVAVHLDHATDVELIDDAIQLGFRSVMFDGSALDYAANVEATCAAASLCQAYGVFLEAELGVVGGKDGSHDSTARTDPEEATSFVGATGVDALAVAVGTSHSMKSQVAVPDFALIARLEAAVPVPLVLHGSSGVADADLAKAVAAGIRKVNIATRANKAFTEAVRAHLDANPDATDPRAYLGAGRSALTRHVEQLIRVLNRESVT